MVQQLGFTGPPGQRRDYEVVELLSSSGGQGCLFRTRLITERFGADLAGAST